MSWPQYVVLALCALGFVHECVKHIRDKKKTSAVVTLLILIMVAYYIAYALVLHAGGFW